MVNVFHAPTKLYGCSEDITVTTLNSSWALSSNTSLRGTYGYKHKQQNWLGLILFQNVISKKLDPNMLLNLTFSLLTSGLYVSVDVRYDDCSFNLGTNVVTLESVLNCLELSVVVVPWLAPSPSIPIVVWVWIVLVGLVSARYKKQSRRWTIVQPLNYRMPTYLVSALEYFFNGISFMQEKKRIRIIMAVPRESKEAISNRVINHTAS